MRRRGKPGNWLATDDYTGFTRYGSDLRRDFWGNYARRPLLRNLQEIATPLDDPRPLPFYRGPDYERYSLCSIEVSPQFVGLTNVRTATNNAAMQTLDFDPGIGEMEVGCTFRVY